MIFKTILNVLRKYLIAGLLVWVPILVTIWVISFIIRLLDNGIKMLPSNYQPDILLGLHFPGIGLIFVLLILFFTGVIVSNYLGGRLVKLGDSVISRVPLVRSVYAAVKQIMEALFHSSSHAFRKVLLVEYPRRGTWGIGFQTSLACDEVNEQTGEKMLGVFVPTTPNPTSGFLIYFPESEVKELNISIDVALKMVISLGVVQPGSVGESQPPTALKTNGML